MTYCAYCRCQTECDSCCGMETFTQKEIDVIVERTLTGIHLEADVKKPNWPLIGGLIFSLTTWAVVGWWLWMLARGAW